MLSFDTGQTSHFHPKIIWQKQSKLQAIQGQLIKGLKLIFINFSQKSFFRPKTGCGGLDQNLSNHFQIFYSVIIYKIMESLTSASPYLNFAPISPPLVHTYDMYSYFLLVNVFSSLLDFIYKQIYARYDYTRSQTSSMPFFFFIPCMLFIIICLDAFLFSIWHFSSIFISNARSVTH